MKFVILILVVLSNIYSCENTTEEKKQLLMKNMVLGKVSQKAIAPTDRDTSQTYIGGYQVIETFNITNEEKKEAINAALLASNYSEEKKRCPFQAQYAISTDSIEIVVSIYPCEKILIIEEGEEEKIFDLNKGNTIEPFFSKLDK